MLDDLEAERQLKDRNQRENLRHRSLLFVGARQSERTLFLAQGVLEQDTHPIKSDRAIRKARCEFEKLSFCAACAAVEGEVVCERVVEPNQEGDVFGELPCHVVEGDKLHLVACVEQGVVFVVA